MRTLVCIGFAEALSAPEVTWSLRDAGFEVVAFSRKNRRSPLRHSNGVKVIDITPPEVDFAKSITDIAKILAGFRSSHYDRRIFFPLDDASAFLGGQLVLDETWKLVGPHGDSIHVALDKSRQTSLAQSAGFNVPSTTSATTAEQVLSRQQDLPLILRPAQAVLVEKGRLRKGRNWICATEDELSRAVGQWGEAWPLLVQPYVQGIGEGIFGLATQDGVQGWTAHRRLRMMNPHGSGSSACVSQPISSELKAVVSEFIRRSNWQGLFMVELLRDRTGTCWFVEFNGRPWGSLALSRRQGFEYPAWAVQAVYGDKLPAENWPLARENVVCQNAGREFMHLLFILRGPKSAGMKDWPSFWRTARHMIWPGRPRFMYNWRRDDWRVFFCDCFYTAWDNLHKSKG